MKKTRPLIIITASLAIIISLSAFLKMPDNGTGENLLTDELYEIIMDGDIICILGNRPWSGILRDLSEKERLYSHAGIIRIRDDRVTVIHAEGNTGHGRNYVNEIPLKDFLDSAVNVGIYRAREIKGSSISDLSLEYIGIPFDWGFDMTDPSRLYCTELVYEIFRHLVPEFNFNTIYVKELGMDIIPLDSSSGSEFFSGIYYSEGYVNPDM